MTDTLTHDQIRPPRSAAGVRRADIDAELRRAAARIAPLWGLEDFVAVNPYLGMSDLHFHDAARRLDQLAGIRSTLGQRFYLDAIERGRIAPQDLPAGLTILDPRAAADPPHPPHVVGSALAAPRVRTFAEVAASVSGTAWDEVMVERISSWAAAYFDRGQAIWRSADRSVGPFTSWRTDASVDRTVDVMGRSGFRSWVGQLPEDPLVAAELALDELGLGGCRHELYLHAVLLRVVGWASFAARAGWDAHLAGRQDDTLLEFAVAALCWEAALHSTFRSGEVDGAWASAVGELRIVDAEATASTEPSPALLLQDAFDRSCQRHLIEQLSAARPQEDPLPEGRPRAQAVFCIDVRSEVVRRHLEAVAPDVETLGFAGFFGMPVELRPLAHATGVDQCPVLLEPGHVVAEAADDAWLQTAAVERRRVTHQVRRAWKSFKMGAISCFSFVGPVGLIYLPKLFSDGFGRTRPVPRPATDGLAASTAGQLRPRLEPVHDQPGSGIPLRDRVGLAAGALRAMSLTEGFAPVVMLVGHGATSVNNPYEGGLGCGACGGHTGEANARVAALLLNDPDVRAALVADGISVPEDTWFVPALHDTTTDRFTLFDLSCLPAGHLELVRELEADLAAAGRRARCERGPRLGVHGAEPVVDAGVLSRSTDWAQVRPEWGLAGCNAFIAAPRSRTAHLDLRGRSFLHSYDWRSDDGFGVLELIMTAPMVVASWISLQYYASTVDNQHFGSGNKTLHNVVGKLGVIEGAAGDLRTGLPWQSVHDGSDLQHEPVRLSVVIEAPLDAMTDVIARHEGVRRLLDNEWLYLFALGEDGRIGARYAGGLSWEPASGDGP